MSVVGADRGDRHEDPDDGYDYRRVCACDFEHAVAAVESALSRHGFSVRVMHDIQATLAAKGFHIRPIRIYEVDGPGDPATSGEGGMEASAAERVQRLMPCRINVFTEEDAVVLTVLRPTLLCRVFPEDDLDDVAVALERVLVAVIDEAAA